MPHDRRECAVSRQLFIVHHADFEVGRLPGVHHAIKYAGAVENRTIEMAQGQKKSCIAWHRAFLKRSSKKHGD